jgi:drug/metabolite transporter (DMT)-like permease
MVENNTLFNHLKLHLVVLIYGFTAILGNLIELPATIIVWYRVFIASLAFVFILWIKKIPFEIPSWKESLKLFFTGLIVAGHWIAFFLAIQLSNVSVTLVCIASTTLFTSLFEPIYLKTRLNITELIIGFFIIIGLYLIFQFEMQYWKGIIAAITCAFLAGWFTVLNKKLIENHRARIISFYEMIGSFVGITIYLLISDNLSFETIIPTKQDIIYLLLLGIVCTAFAFTIQVDVMKQLSAFMVSLTINLEPIYGIVLAFILFNEHEILSKGFYFGTAIILVSVFGYPLYGYWLKKRAS